MLYGFAIIIVTMVAVAGVLGKGLVTGILYVLVLIMDVFVAGILLSFGNDNSKNYNIGRHWSREYYSLLLL